MIYFLPICFSMCPIFPRLPWKGRSSAWGLFHWLVTRKPWGLAKRNGPIFRPHMENNSH